MKKIWLGKRGSSKRDTSYVEAVGDEGEEKPSMVQGNHKPAWDIIGNRKGKQQQRAKRTEGNDE